MWVILLNNVSKNMLWKRIAYISLLLFKFSGGMPPPPYRFKPLALKLTEICGAMWQSNLLFSIVVGASFDEAVLSFLSVRDWSLSLENCFKILKSLVRVCIKSIKRPNGRKTYGSYTSTLSTRHVERWTACTCSNSSIAMLYWIGSLDPK